jgi:hypothetical protein
MKERNFFHRPSAQAVRKSPVVNDLASAADAVVQIPAPGCDKVRTQRGFLVLRQYTNVTVVSSREQTLQRRRGLSARVHSALPA